VNGSSPLRESRARSVAATRLEPPKRRASLTFVAVDRKSDPLTRPVSPRSVAATRSRATRRRERPSRPRRARRTPTRTSVEIGNVETTRGERGGSATPLFLWCDPRHSTSRRCRRLPTLHHASRSPLSVWNLSASMEKWQVGHQPTAGRCSSGSGAAWISAPGGVRPAATAKCSPPSSASCR